MYAYLIVCYVCRCCGGDCEVYRLVSPDAQFVTCLPIRAVTHPRAVFLNRRASAQYRALASIIPGRERFFWNLSF